MIIKKYISNTVDEAQNLIRQELGPSAVILTSRYVKQSGWRSLFAANKVEVTAAIEEDDLKAFTGNKMGGSSDRKQKPRTAAPKTNLDSNLSDLKRSFAQTLPMNSEEEDRLNISAEAREFSRTGNNTMGNSTYNARGRKPNPPSTVKERPAQQREGLSPEEERALRKLEALRSRHKIEERQTASAAETADAPKSTMDMMKLSKGLMQYFSGGDNPAPVDRSEQARNDEAKGNSKPTARMVEGDVERLRRMVKEEVAKSQKTSSGMHAENPMDGTVRFLVSKGIDRSIAEEIETKLESRYGKGDMTMPGKARTERLNGLKKELAARIKTAEPICLSPGEPTVVALVGPTGVGKTTTLVKIAAQYAGELKKRVGVITLDVAKKGTAEQMRSWLSGTNCQVTAAGSRSQLLDALAEYQECDLILIDSAGRSQYHVQEVEALADMLATVDNLQAFLTISATTKDLDVYGIIQQFDQIPIVGLIFTKLDETIAHGILLNVGQKTDKAISYLTNGQGMPDDLKIADADEIARSILVQHNAGHYESLRQLVAR